MSEQETQTSTAQETTTTTETETFTKEQVQEMLAKETQGLKSKVEELLGEKKTVSQKAAELEEQQRKAEETRLAEKEEFRTLWEREQEAKRELQEKYETFSKKVQQQEVKSEASKIAAELTRDKSRSELLEEKIASFARYSEDGIKLEMGGVEVDRAKVVEHLKQAYPFLVDGSQASGSGASGAGSRAPEGKQVSRSEFDQMSQAARSKFSKEGGKVVND